MNSGVGTKQISGQTVLPLLIGVTGHRDIPAEDVTCLKQKVRAIFEYFQKEFPTTPIMLISALADGADRLTADVALDVGIGLVVPLPMPQKLYEQDFDQDSVDHFRALLAQAALSIELPLEQGNSIEQVRAGGFARSLQYHAAGRFIVKHCQVLIALWDGVTNGPTGGTSQVVQMKLEGLDPYSTDSSILFNPLQTGPVYFIMIRRKKPASEHQDIDFIVKHQAGQNPLEGVQLLYPLTDDRNSTRDDEYQRTLSCIERFNTDSESICRLMPDILLPLLFR